MSNLNVLLLMVDDMVPVLGSHREAHIVPTPNLDRLASRGVLFQNAHTPAPICNPARTAIFTGLQPFSSGVYGNQQWWRPALPGLTTLPEHFRCAGYKAIGCGKLLHHTLGFNPPDQWDAYHDIVYDDLWDRTSRANYDFETVPEPEGYPYNGLDYRAHEFDWGSLPKEEREYGDFAAVEAGVDVLSQDHDRPFFLACGTFHPHVPWYAPQSYYDALDPALIEIPEEQYSCDWENIPESGRRLASVGPQGNNQYDVLVENDILTEARRWYYANIAFTDAMIGHVLDALDRSAYRENTIVAFVGDHGFHVGEKRHFGKQALWRESTSVPMLIAGPGLPDGTVVEAQVSSIDLGATLADLSGVSGFDDRDSASLVAAIRGESDQDPVVCTHLQSNFAVITDSWRYIRYTNGSDELYNLREDPHELRNLASDPSCRATIEELASSIPVDTAPQAPTRQAYDFDPSSYTWTQKPHSDR